MPDASKPAPRRRFIVALILLPFAVLALVEGALRVCGIGRPDDAVVLRFMNPEGAYADEADGQILRDPVLFWRLRPGWTDPNGRERYGAYGFRTDFRAAKTEGVRRIACVGDSNTYGVNVGPDEAWPAVLGRALRAAPGGAACEAINLGVPGYTSWQVRRFLETKGASLAPDVVVVESGAFNEFLPALDATDRDQGRRPAWAKPHLVELLSRLVRTKTPPVDTEEAKNRLAHFAPTSYDGPRRVPLADFEDDLRAVAAWCAAHGARVVFVVHPLPAGTVRSNPVATDYADVVRRVASTTGAPLADAWAAFRASGRADAELFVDLCHATPLGNELTAMTVADAMGRLPSPTR